MGAGAVNSKKKGNGGERELLHILHDAGFPVYRNDQQYVGGFERPDLALTIGGVKYHVEVKRTEKLSLYTAMAQAVHDANGKAVPVVIHRRNREEWLVIERLQDFIQDRRNGN